MPCRSLVAMLLCIASLASAHAQQVAPSAVTQHPTTLDRLALRTNSSTALEHDMQRGAAIGGISGGVLGLVGVAVYVWSNTRPTCCEQAPRKVRFTRIFTIEALSVVGGAAAGTVVGLGYHFNKPARSASRAMQPNER